MQNNYIEIRDILLKELEHLYKITPPITLKEDDEETTIKRSNLYKKEHELKNLVQQYMIDKPKKRIINAPTFVINDFQENKSYHIRRIHKEKGTIAEAFDGLILRIHPLSIVFAVKKQNNGDATEYTIYANWVNSGEWEILDLVPVE